jgi:hypothetical protein
LNVPVFFYIVVIKTYVAAVLSGIARAHVVKNSLSSYVMMIIKTKYMEDIWSPVRAAGGWWGGGAVKNGVTIPHLS